MTGRTPDAGSAIATAGEGASEDAAPTHTPTFLFTDVEGSTRLWEQTPDAMAPALERGSVVWRRRANEPCVSRHFAMSIECSARG